MKTAKDIFKNHNSLSEQEITAYNANTLTPKERNLVEQKVAQDDFNADAFEGIENNPEALKELESARFKVSEILKSKQVFWKFHYTLIIVGVISVAVTLVAPYLFSDTNEPFFGKNTTKPRVKTVGPAIVAVMTDQEIEESEYIEDSEMVLPEVIISYSPVVMNDKYKVEPKVVSSEFEKALEIKKIDNPKLTTIELPTLNEIVYTNVPTFYVEKFLMVDYSSIYSDQIPVSVIEYSGTPANVENADKKSEPLESQKPLTKFVYYKTYLFETQELFGVNNFKGALKRFNVILTHYPNDLNAHFYGGLCYYNLKQFSKAIEHFEVAQKHQYNTFKIDAEWYHAKALYQQKAYEKAGVLLNKIIDDNDYYAKQAMELKKKMSK